MTTNPAASAGPKRRAILSVYDKTGIADFALRLADLNYELYSTGNTKAAIAAAVVEVHSISDLTGFPEILGGRVKTLHPAVHGGLLAKRDDPAQMAELTEHNLGTIDLLVGNLYPFAQTIAQPGVTLADALENIDIGGPTMIRAAAKNFPAVVVVVDPADYPQIADALAAGEVSQEVRRELAAKAFQHVAAYDTLIAAYLRAPGDHFPQQLTLGLEKVQDLRYGENPHQSAAFYRQVTPGATFPGLATAKQLHGKELSYNNILDADAAINVVRDFAAPTVAIIKHANPAGIASNDDLRIAYERAQAGDPLSAFGGIVAANRPISEEVAHLIAATFYEVVIAPSFAPEAVEILGKKKALRLLEVGDIYAGAEALAMSIEARPVVGGYIIQTRDITPERDFSLKPVTTRHPHLEELNDLIFAWRVVKHVKSNAIVLVKDRALVGMGAGQPSRVDSVKLALAKAGERAKGSILASDAFFPFPDGVEAAGYGGVTAIIQPGGSVNDESVIKEANTFNIAMVFTGQRHFRH